MRMGIHESRQDDLSGGIEFRCALIRQCIRRSNPLDDVISDRDGAIANNTQLLKFRATPRPSRTAYRDELSRMDDVEIHMKDEPRIRNWNSSWCVSDPLARFARVSPSVRGRAAEGGRGSVTRHLDSGNTPFHHSAAEEPSNLDSFLSCELLRLLIPGIRVTSDADSRIIRQHSIKPLSHRIGSVSNDDLSSM